MRRFLVEIQCLSQVVQFRLVVLRLISVLIDFTCTGRSPFQA